MLQKWCGYEFDARSRDFGLSNSLFLWMLILKQILFAANSVHSVVPVLMSNIMDDRGHKVSSLWLFNHYVDSEVFTFTFVFFSGSISVARTERRLRRISKRTLCSYSDDATE